MVVVGVADMASINHSRWRHCGRCELGREGGGKVVGR